MITASFYFLSVLTIISALLVVFLRNPVNSVIFLVITFFCIACHYMILGAQFLAAAHVIVYAGAIMVLFLYVIMMLNLNKEDEPRTTWSGRLIGTMIGGVLGVIFFAGLRMTQYQAMDWTTSHGIGLIKNLGKVLLNEYALPFEAVSILLLAAMVGVVMLAKHQEKQELNKF